jgi:hypothetical protein
VPGLHRDDPAGPRTYRAHGLVAAGFGDVDAGVKLGFVAGQNLRAPRSLQPSERNKCVFGLFGETA